MSYILDALKKSEGERVDNREVPDWKTSHQGNYTPTAQGPTRQQIVSISVLSGILVALLIGAGVWLYSGTSGQTSIQTARPSSSDNKAAAKPNQRVNSAQFAQNSGMDSAGTSSNKSTKTTFSKFSEVQSDAQQIAQAKSKYTFVNKPRPRPAKKTVTKKKEPVVKKAGKGSVVFSDKPLSQTSSKPTTKQVVKKRVKKKVKVVALSELPDNIRRSIPAIGFSGHVYSSEDPKQSSVMINGRKMKEGTSVSRDLVLEKITETGAQFSFRGYHFRLGALVDYQSNGR